jgi:hypothetical protein
VSMLTYRRSNVYGRERNELAPQITAIEIDTKIRS